MQRHLHASGPVLLAECDTVTVLTKKNKILSYPFFMKWYPWKFPLMGLPCLSLFGQATFCFLMSPIFTPPAPEAPASQTKGSPRTGTTGGKQVWKLAKLGALFFLDRRVLNRVMLCYKWRNTNQIQTRSRSPSFWLTSEGGQRSWTHQHY